MALRSPPSPPPKASADARRHVAGATFVAVLALGFVLAVANPVLRDVPSADLRSGAWARTFQAAFDEASPVAAAAGTLRGVTGWILFEEGPAGVLVGDDGWLFSAEELAWDAGADARLRANLERIAAAAATLRDEGIELVVVPVPAKARVEADRLSDVRLPAEPAARYDRALDALAAAGVAAVDARAPLVDLKRRGGAPFLRTDTHWTPEGAAAVAADVAAVVRRAAPDADLDGASYELRRGPAAKYRGDLLRLFEFGPWHDRLAPPDDVVAPRSAVATSAPSTDLFAAPELPVVLVGTSYSADARWGFADALRLELGVDVLEAARSGAGALAPMEAYLAGEARRASPPDVVVWEIPERYLTQPRLGPPSASAGADLPGVLP